MFTRPIDSVFTYNDKYYQVKEEARCVGCAFFSAGCPANGIVNPEYPITGDCTISRRTDNKSAIFKELSDEDILKKYGKVYVFVEKNTVSNCIYCDLKGKGCFNVKCYPSLRKDKKWGYYKEINVESNKQENNMKPFDLEAAKAGKPVCTRNGRKARIICFNKKGEYPIVALVNDYNEEEYIKNYDRFGKKFTGSETTDDLMMLPEKKEGWINIYHDCDEMNITKDDNVYSSKEAAISSAQIVDGQHYITSIKIEWEE